MVFGSDNPFLSAHKIKDNIDASTGKKEQHTVVSSQAASVTSEKILNLKLSAVKVKM
jgi:hypothetical protein